MKIAFLGSNYYAFDAFKVLLKHADIDPVLVIGLDENRFSRSGMASYYYQGSRFFSYANGLGISSHITENLNADTIAQKLLSDSEPDYVFAMGWPDILDKDVLELSRNGFVGIHPSMLPKYRGGAPLNWQLIEMSVGQRNA